MPARMLYIYTLSPLHCGTGQSADVIDLPVARERVTNWPVIPGSSVKGPLKEGLRPAPGADARLWRSAFGPDTDDAENGAGSLVFGDARLLCFPARSYAGAFAWLTCPLALLRWQRDHQATGLQLDLPALPPFDSGSILVGVSSRLTIESRSAQQVLLQVLLEDLDLGAQVSPETAQIADTLAQVAFAEGAWRDEFRARFAIVADDVFTFLTETATEVAARVRLNAESKTAAGGALWYEEAVPAEALFSGPVIEARTGQPPAGDSFSLFQGAQHLQLGGHSTIGRGLVRLTLTGGAA